LQNLRALLELTGDLSFRVDEILDLRSNALLVRQTNVGTARAGGGVFERTFLFLRVFGADGLVTRLEQFDVDREDEALARFDELTAEPAMPRFVNAETRRNDRLREAWAARDWERVAACFGPGFRLIDRRSYAHLELDRDQHLKSLRMRFDMSSSRLASEVFATRGDRLALGRARFELADRDVGPSESELLWIGESDEHGDCATLIALDPDDLDAAYAELDHRYLAGEAAAFAQPVRWVSAFRRAVADGDAEAFAALRAPDFVVHDHSPLGWGTLDGPAYTESVKALVALAPDFRIRTEHLWLSGRGALGIHVVLGTYEGGGFEQPRITVSEIDAEARERRRDIYTFDQFAEARARFEAIGASAAP